MKKFNKKMLLDYISGNDIEGATIDELENSSKFMLAVLKMTKDKKMYSFCSDALKRDYQFVKEVILLFQDDYLFLMDVFDEFSKHVDPDDIMVFELLCILAKIEEKDKQNTLFSALALSKYTESRAIIDSIIEEEKSIEMLKTYGMGFLIVLSQYENSLEILNYFAKKMVSEIFYQNENLSLEDFMHKSFPNFYQTEDVNTLLIGYIAIKDSYLADHIVVHIDILDDLKRDLERVKRNWKDYERIVNETKVDLLYQEMWKCVEEHTNTIDYFAILDSVAIELGLEELFTGDGEALTHKSKYAVNEDEEEEALRFKTHLRVRMKQIFSNGYLDRKADDYNESILKLVK